MFDTIYEICYRTQTDGRTWSNPKREFFADRVGLDDRLHRLYVERIGSHGPNYRPATEHRPEYSYPGVRHEFDYVREISLTDATVTPLIYVPEQMPRVERYTDVEAHLVIFAAGGADLWSADGDLDDMHRHIEAWGAQLHALVTVPGHIWADGDFAEYAYQIGQGLYRTTDEPQMPAVPFADCYNANGDSTLKATHWFWQPGDTWVAVVGDDDRSGWWDDVPEGSDVPEPREYPIDQPPEGRLVWRNVDGDQSEMVRAET